MNLITDIEQKKKRRWWIDLERGMKIFDKKENGNGLVYRGIIELICRFGYVSIREVMYGFDLDLSEACHRLDYLQKLEFIEKFPSETRPPFFFCLTKLGKMAIRERNISDRVTAFQPSNYNISTQWHNRTLMMIFLALKKIFGPDLISWKSEWMLRSEAKIPFRERFLQTKRLVDGEFTMRVREWRMSDESDVSTDVYGPWRCAVEYERTLKAAWRYRRQFRNLRREVYDPFSDIQNIHLILFLCESPNIEARLIRHLIDSPPDYGECVFLFGQAADLIARLGNAPLTGFVSSSTSNGKGREIFAREMNRSKTAIQQIW